MHLPDILDQQKVFDGFVDATNCTRASDRLACLRAVPYSQLMAALDPPGLLSYRGNLPWQPMVDGELFQSNPLTLVQDGKYAKVLYSKLYWLFYLKASSVPQVPFIAGSCEDEGT